MKKLIILFVGIFILSLVSISATPCTPDAGYNKCAIFEKSNSWGNSNSHALVKTQINNQVQGNLNGNYVVGKAWISFKFEGDNFYLFENKISWDSIWNTCNGESCSGWKSKLSKQGDYYVIQNSGDTYNSCPVFVATDYDYVTASNGDWSWVTASNGYGWIGASGCFDLKGVECYADSDCSTGLVCDKSGSWETWSCKEPPKVCGDNVCQTEISETFDSCPSDCNECSFGETECFGGELFLCEDTIPNLIGGNTFINKSFVEGQCGYTLPVVDDTTNNTLPNNQTNNNLLENINFDQVLFKVGDFEITLLYLILSLGGIVLLRIITK